MEFIYLIFACLRLRFLDMETNPGPWRPVHALCRTLCSNVRGLAGNLSDLTVASSQFDTLFCAETLVSDMRHVSELLVSGFSRPVLLWGARCLGLVGWRHMYEMVTKHFANPNLSVVVAKCWVFRVCGVRQNLYVYSLYRNPDLHGRILYCLLASMAAVQAEDVRASFLFVGDLNGHDQEWLGSTTTNRHGVAAFDFATVSGCAETTPARVGVVSGFEC